MTVRAMGGLYAGGAGIGLAGLVLPHGKHFNVAADVIAIVAALSVAAYLFTRSTIGRGAVHWLLALATTMIAGGIYSGRGDDISMSAAVMLVWVALAAALFLSPRGAAAHVAFGAAAYAVVLALSGNAGAPAEWAFVTGTAVVAAGVTTRTRAELTAAARTDHLTGLANRDALYDMLGREMTRAGRSGAPLSVAVVDLDGFKQLNDRIGHLAADRELVELTAKWRQRLRPADLLARFGGDEFVVVLPDTGAVGAEEVISRLRRVGSDPRWSAGIAAWDGDETIEELLARADAALYREKALNRR